MSSLESPTTHWANAMVKEEAELSPEELLVSQGKQGSGESAMTQSAELSQPKPHSGGDTPTEDDTDKTCSTEQGDQSKDQASSVPECDADMVVCKESSTHEMLDEKGDFSQTVDHSSPEEEDTCTIRPSQSTHSVASSTASHLPDADWSITFEQFLASVLTEPPLVDFYEKTNDILLVIDRYRNRRVLERNKSFSGSPPGYVS